MMLKFFIPSLMTAVRGKKSLRFFTISAQAALVVISSSLFSIAYAEGTDNTTQKTELKIGEEIKADLAELEAETVRPVPVPPAITPKTETAADRSPPKFAPKNYTVIDEQTGETETLPFNKETPSREELNKKLSKIYTETEEDAEKEKAALAEEAKKSGPPPGPEEVFSSFYDTKNIRLPEKLQELFTLIYTEHPTVEGAKERKNAARLRREAADKQLNPSLTLSGFTGQQEISQNGQEISNFRKQADLTVDQPLFTGGRASSAAAQAEGDLRVETAVAQEEIDKLMRDAGESFVRLASRKELIILLEKTVDVLKKRYEAVQTEEQNGERTLTDIALSESRLADAEARLAKAKAELRAEEARFYYFVGGRPAFVQFAKEGAALRLFNETSEEIPDVAALYLRNNELKRAQAEIQSAGAAVDVAQARYMPQVTLEGRMSFNESRDTLDRRDSFDNQYLIARFTAPIYSRGVEYKEYDRAEALSRRAKNEYLSTAGDVSSRYREAAENYFSGVKTVSAFERTQIAAQKALKGVTLEYQYGFRTILDVLDAERELLQTSSELINAKADRLSALIQIKYFLNELSPKTLYEGDATASKTAVKDAVASAETEKKN